MTCEAVRYQDTMQCALCGLQWDVDDPDRPACAARAQAKDRGRAIGEAYLKRIYELLNDEHIQTGR